MQKSQTIQDFFLIFTSLLMLILFMFKCLQDRPRVKAVLSEPALALLVGMVFSGVVSLFFSVEEVVNYQWQSQPWGGSQGQQDLNLAESILNFQTRVFFMALLPPILFNSGYQLQRELFYRHFGAIALFAVLGTCISGLATGGMLSLARYFNWLGDFNPSILELLIFGSMIAATDTVSVVGILREKKVDPHLFSLVFGESALNDAVALVLFKTLKSVMVNDNFDKEPEKIMQSLLVYFADLLQQTFCSPALGWLFAICMGLAFKHVDMREHPLLELSLYILPMYVPFIMSEALGLSGMITIFVTGIFAKRYMEPNVADSTRQHAKMLFSLFAFLAETCIFLELGLSVFGLSGSFQWKFVACAFFAAVIGRALSVYPLAFLFNVSLTRRIKGCCCTHDTTLESETTTLPSESSTLDSFDTTLETPHHRRDKIIPVRFMHMLCFAGLRGAVAYACAREFPDTYGHRDEFVAATMVIVFVTIVVMGGATAPLMDRLDIRTNVDPTEYMRHWRAKRTLKGRMHRFEYHYIYQCVVRKEEQNKETDFQYDDDSVIIHHSMTPIITNKEMNVYEVFASGVSAEMGCAESVSDSLTDPGSFPSAFRSLRARNPGNSNDSTPTINIQNDASPFASQEHHTAQNGITVHISGDFSNAFDYTNHEEATDLENNKIVSIPATPTSNSQNDASPFASHGHHTEQNHIIVDISGDDSNAFDYTNHEETTDI